jgi:isocitrate lyase
MTTPTDREAAIQAWFDEPRFADTGRLHTARDVADQRGTIAVDHPVARDAAAGFHDLLRRRFDEGRSITTFGPYSPGQAVVQHRHGIEAVYLGGWATSAKGSVHEDPGPDLASYALGTVPDEAAAIVRALLAADRDQELARRRWTPAERAATPPIDYRPFLIADADTGHGGDAHVRNVIRRFVEVGVPGYHIEDQRAGAKKCGHQDGKVLVSTAEQLRRLNAARFQLDVMGVPGIIVARTDAEAATLIDDVSDERDRPFVLGATRVDLPPYRVVAIVVQERLHELGLTDVRGHLLYALTEADRDRAGDWLAETGLDVELVSAVGTERRTARAEGRPLDGPAVLDGVGGRIAERWAQAADLATGAEAGDGPWDPELPRTPDGYYRFRGGSAPAIVRSIAAAPFADLLWMETATADLEDARTFAEAVHAVHPRAMLAYNLSPSFNWDTTGMDDEAMRRFPEELGRLGFVFTFITYGGHQIDGLAAEEFSAALRRDGMLALARLQRRLRLLESPYRTPQALVGSQRGDAALMAATGRTASTSAMGAASTHRQHLVAIEPAPAVLEARLADLGRAGLRASLWPSRPWSEQTDLTVRDADGATRLVVTWQVVEGLADGGPTLVVQVDGPDAQDEELVAVVVGYVRDRTGVPTVHEPPHEVVAV